MGSTGAGRGKAEWGGGEAWHPTSVPPRKALCSSSSTPGDPAPSLSFLASQPEDVEEGEEKSEEGEEQEGEEATEGGSGGGRSGGLPGVMTATWDMEEVQQPPAEEDDPEDDEEEERTRSSRTEADRRWRDTRALWKGHKATLSD